MTTGIPLISDIRPKNDADFGVVEDTYVIGGFRRVDTLVERDAIPTLRRKEGMFVFVNEDGTLYFLDGGIGNGNWAEHSGGGGGGGLTAGVHKSLRQLIHLADNDGPMEGFASGSFFEELPDNSPFPTTRIWWTSPLKTSKIVENDVTYSGPFVATDIWKVYDTDGTTVLATLTDTYDYTTSIITPKINRTVA